MLKSVSTRLKLLFSSGLIITGALVFVSFSGSNHSSDSIMSKDGVILSIATKEPFTGRVIDTVANRIVNYVIEGGIKNGDFEVFWLDGTRSISGKIINNKNEGKWRYYYPDGKLELEGNFKSDVAVDKWIWYYNNGKIKEEGNFVNGKREGFWTLYNSDGTLKSKLYFVKGKITNSLNTRSSVVS